MKKEHGPLFYSVLFFFFNGFFRQKMPGSINTNKNFKKVNNKNLKYISISHHKLFSLQYNKTINK
jgi:hypothetical protein